MSIVLLYFNATMEMLIPKNLRKLFLWTKSRTQKLMLEKTQGMPENEKLAVVMSERMHPMIGAELFYLRLSNRKKADLGYVLNRISAFREVLRLLNAYFNRRFEKSTAGLINMYVKEVDNLYQDLLEELRYGNGSDPNTWEIVWFLYYCVIHTVYLIKETIEVAIETEQEKDATP